MGIIEFMENLRERVDWHNKNWRERISVKLLALSAVGMLGLAVMLWPSPAVPVKVTLPDETTSAPKPAAEHRPVATQTKQLRDPFSPEHETREEAKSMGSLQPQKNAVKANNKTATATTKGKIDSNVVKQQKASGAGSSGAGAASHTAVNTQPQLLAILRSDAGQRVVMSIAGKVYQVQTGGTAAGWEVTEIGDGRVWLEQGGIEKEITLPGKLIVTG